MISPQSADDERSALKLSAGADRPEREGVEPSRDVEVEFSDTQNQLAVDRAGLIALVREVLAIEGVSRASISVVLVDNPTIHEINRSQLGHDWPTDVITFPLSSPGEDLLAGELVVSAEMARDTAREQGQQPWAELALYLVHGLLHLQGYDDQEPEDIERMRRREGEVLALLGLTNPFSLVASSPSPAKAPE